MRNPLDKNPVDSDSTVLNEGNLAKFGSLLAPTKLSPERKIALLKEMSSKSSKKSDMSSHAPLDGSDDQSEQWKVTVIRGKDVQIQKLDNSETEEIPLTDVFLD